MIIDSPTRGPTRPSSLLFCIIIYTPLLLLLARVSLCMRGHKGEKGGQEKMVECTYSASE